MNQILAVGRDIVSLQQNAIIDVGKGRYSEKLERIIQLYSDKVREYKGFIESYTQKELDDLIEVKYGGTISEKHLENFQRVKRAYWRDAKIVEEELEGKVVCIQMEREKTLGKVKEDVMVSKEQECISFSESDIGKATVATTTLDKKAAQEQLDRAIVQKIMKRTSEDKDLEGNL